MKEITMSIEIKKKIETHLKAFSENNLTQNSLDLFIALGYNTNRQAPLDNHNYLAFKAAFTQTSTMFNEEKALVKEWKYVDILFQLSKNEVAQQNSLFDTKRVDDKDIQSYLFFVIELSGNTYSRTVLAQITREVNKLFPYTFCYHATAVGAPEYDTLYHSFAIKTNANKFINTIQ